MQTTSMKTAKYLSRGLAGILLGANLLLTSGCFLFVVGAVAAGAVGTVAYVDGKLEVSLGYKYEAVVAAANQAIVQLKFAKPEERKDALSDTLISHMANDDRVEIVVTNVSENLTKVDIRVGTLGDRQMSQTVLDKIKANL